MPGKARAAEAASFAGFADDGAKFFKALAKHQSREWFQSHKAEFEAGWNAPMKLALAEVREKIDAAYPHADLDEPRVFRIFRDVRFSKDKSPYKTHHAAGFGWAGGSSGSEGGRSAEEGGAGGGYFSLAPGEIYIGGGMWHPEPARLAAFRRLVDTDPARVLAAAEEAGFVKEFGALEGDRLSRVPQGYAKDHPHAELLKLKDVIFSRRVSDAEVFSPKLPDTLAKSFAKARPVFDLLASLGG